jgi:hypothetical protein
MLGFLKKTRQNFVPYAALSFTAGQNSPFELNRVGLIARIILKVSGVYTCAHASKTTFTKKFKAPWTLIDRLKLNLNTGVNLIDCSGYGLFLRNVLYARNHRIDEVIAGSDVFRFGNTVSAGGTANNIDFVLEIPIAINDRDPVGFLMMQSQEAVANVRIDWAATLIGALMTDADVVVSAVAITVTPEVELFSIPRTPADYPDTSLVHQIFEDMQMIGTTGEQKYIVPRGGIYMKILHSIELNGALAGLTDIDKLTLTYNQNQVPYEISAQIQRFEQLRKYGRTLPDGCFVWDFFYQGIPNLAGFRDLINSGAVTEMWSKPYVATGATLGSGNNKLFTIREQLAPMAAAG